MLKYKYNGTIQVPLKAFRGDIDFARACLPTVEPNVDLGVLTLLVTYLNEHGGSLDSGAVTIRDNLATSKMTTSNLSEEWTKVYGPIMTSAAGLCRKLAPDYFAKLPVWLCNFLEGMEVSHYLALFGDTPTVEVERIFAAVRKFRPAIHNVCVPAELEGLLCAIHARAMACKPMDQE